MQQHEHQQKSAHLSDVDLRRLRLLCESSLRHTARQAGLDSSRLNLAHKAEAAAHKVAILCLSPELHAAVKDLPGKISLKLRHAVDQESALVFGIKQPSSRREKSPAAPKADYFRLNLTLPDDLDAKLSEFGRKVSMTGGARLRKTEILRALARLLLELPVDMAGIRDEDELLDRLRSAAGIKK